MQRISTDCETNNGDLAQMIENHLTATGIRTFIVGMEGASEGKLEELGIAGGADPHDDYCGGLTSP